MYVKHETWTPPNTASGGRFSVSDPHPSSLQDALDTRLTSIDSARYRANTESIVTSLIDWLQEERDVDSLDAIDTQDCRRWVQHLARRVRDEEIAASTAHTYYGTARSFFRWCVDDEELSENPMRPNKVERALPEDQGDRERQAWPDNAREQLLAHVDEAAHDALEDDDGDAERAFRDRAIAYLLADTGARGAELFAVSNDDDRNGITWNDVDLEAGVVTVLGKSRTIQGVQLPGPAAERLERWQRLLDPPGDWPVIPTRDAATKYQHARAVLREHKSDSEIEAELADVEIDEYLRANAITPPALTTRGARNVMERLCDEADVAVDGEYLKPHGARRALGHRLYHEASAETAQNALRHKSVETTKEAYEHQKPSDLADDVEGILYGDQESE
nr:tyrosine-type recombinase/integrase [Halarchaeum solikamskense]